MFDKDRGFLVSPFNTRAGFDWPDPMEIVDSTLRKTCSPRVH
ncbi:hypothetical protein [Actinosynnema sp. ALI-1.44]|nr:hypothetical protein [Actinosynnema sp. ALI-1.44]